MMTNLAKVDHIRYMVSDLEFYSPLSEQQPYARKTRASTRLTRPCEPYNLLNFLKAA
jgi:hypothetical protein